VAQLERHRERERTHIMATCRLDMLRLRCCPSPTAPTAAGPEKTSCFSTSFAPLLRDGERSTTVGARLDVDMVAVRARGARRGEFGRERRRCAATTSRRARVVQSATVETTSTASS